MPVFLLYLLTAGATGFQAYWQIMWAIWGKPVHWLEVLAFFSALGLIGVSFVVFFNPRRACRAGLFCLVGLWAYYGPALINSFADASLESLTRNLAVFIPGALLVASSIHMPVLFSRIHRNRPSSFFFPTKASTKLGQRALAVCLVLLGSYILALFLFTGVEKTFYARAKWEVLYVEEKPFARFAFQDLRGFDGAETDSAEVIGYLQKERPVEISIGVILTYDFGKVRALGFNVMYLHGFSFRPQGLGHFSPYDPFSFHRKQ